MYYLPNFSKGVARLTFDVRLEGAFSAMATRRDSSSLACWERK